MIIIVLSLSCYTGEKSLQNCEIMSTIYHNNIYLELTSDCIQEYTNSEVNVTFVVDIFSFNKNVQIQSDITKITYSCEDTEVTRISQCEEQLKDVVNNTSGQLLINANNLSGVYSKYPVQVTVDEQ
ncbi:Hypothetical_protein [Hexamita inflata]|uniref:Hypothetical_protein n=1 Tax=Hexamita inflata TaxID=28002 RepID=A0AA86VDZ2_9EUKA|nr:Hypothetical protein HINF_LOCUS27538 [Hexamita inflata]CAI9963883.1 Hypothetical protein HINF_LOCUS51528 [Hexamita inflata]